MRITINTTIDIINIKPKIIPIVNKWVSINITIYANTNPNKVETIK